MAEAIEAPVNQQSISTEETPRAEEEIDQDDENVKITKATRFWKHPSLRDIPIEQKRQYLYEKGLTDGQIHKAWDRIMEEDELQQPETKPERTGPLNSHPEPPTLPPTRQQPPSMAHPYPPQQPINPQYASQIPSPDPYRNSYPSPYPPRYDEEEGPGPFLQGVSLVALGGFVGLTAAAATRWLNGGDFELLPPRYSQGSDKKPPHLALRTDHTQDADHSVDMEAGVNHGEAYTETIEEEYATDEEPEEYDGDFVPASQRELLETVQTLSQSMQDHVSLQEKILQKISNHGSSYTNSSMEFLRASSGISNGAGRKDNAKSAEMLQLWAQLLEIKGGLQNLDHTQRAMNSTTDESEKLWQSQLSNTLSKLDKCVEAVQDSIIPSQSKPSCPEAESSDVPSAPTVKNSSASGSNEATATTIPEVNTSENLQNSKEVPTLRQAVRQMATENDPTTLRVGAQLLYLYVINLMGKPDNPRYRKIYTTNDSFQKVKAMVGAKDLLFAVGFEEGKGSLEWLASNPSLEAEGLAMAKLQEASAALSILKSNKSSPGVADDALAVLSPDLESQSMLPPTGELSTPSKGPPLVSHPQTEGNHPAVDEDQIKEKVMETSKSTNSEVVETS